MSRVHPLLGSISAINLCAGYAAERALVPGNQCLVDRQYYDPWIWNVILVYSYISGWWCMGLHGRAGRLLLLDKSGLFGTLFTRRLDSITSMNVTHSRLRASVRAQ
jgi:hypothetical protein